MISLFKPRIHFNAIDPEGDGLREMVTSEKLEPEAITLDDDLNEEGQLMAFWQDVESDIQNDPNWFRFSDE